MITTISMEINKLSTSGASSTENAMLVVVRELTTKVRTCREVFMAIISPPKSLSTPLMLSLLQYNVVLIENERIPESIAWHFTKS